MKIKNNTARLAANFVLFQAGWFCLAAAPAGYDLAGGAAALAAHWLFVAGRGEARFVAVVTLVGACADSAFAAAGVFAFAKPASAALPWLAPPWLLMLWALFATLPPHSLGWLARRRLLAAGMAAAAGPLAYWGGAQLAGKLVPLASPPAFFVVLGVWWAALMTPLFVLRDKMLRQSATKAQAALN